MRLDLLAGVSASLLLFQGPAVSSDAQEPWQARPGMSPDQARAVQEAAARHFDLPLEVRLDLGEGVGLDLVLIPPGEFWMGSPLDCETLASIYEGQSASHNELEKPRHHVTLTRPFYIARYEVTRRQWRQIMASGSLPAAGDRLPAQDLTWHDCVEFCRRVSELSGWKIRLPTETEWEYACRAGTTTEFSFGDALTPEQANVNGAGAVAVGSYSSNAWGLYDMHGNIVEWVTDAYGGYPSEPQIDPPDPPDHFGRMLRGGGYDDRAGNCRSAYRYAHHPAMGDQHSGFRIVMVISDPAPAGLSAGPGRDRGCAGTCPSRRNHRRP